MHENCLCGKLSIAFHFFQSCQKTFREAEICVLSTGKKGKYSSLMLSLFYKKTEEEMFIIAWLCSSSDMKKKRETLLES